MHVSDFPYDEEHPQTPVSRTAQSERGYSWFFLYLTRSWFAGFFISLFVVASGLVFYLWYDHPGNDTTPDGTAGLVYAFIGTGFFILAALLYTLRRRSHKRNTGQLHTALNWHIFLALTGLALLIMHAFGHFAAISGTYALCGLIVLSISGLIGRMLDRVLPWLIANEVDKAVTAQGDDRVEVVSRKLQAIVVHNTQKIRGFHASPPSSTEVQHSSSVVGKPPLHVPWDLAYISLEPTQQELDRDAPRYRFIPDKKSGLNQPGALMPGADEQVAELQFIRSAMRREQFYRYIIRYWRILHICLAFITIGLVIWHIVFACTILFPRFMH